MSGYCPARRFDDIAIDSPVADYFPARRFDAMDADGHALTALPQKLTQQLSGLLSHAGSRAADISPAISSSFEGLTLQEQPQGKVMQKLVSHTSYTAVQTTQQVREPESVPRTFTTTDRLDSESRAIKGSARVFVNEDSQGEATGLRMKDTCTVTVTETVVVNQPGARGGNRESVAREVPAADQVFDQPAGDRGNIRVCVSMHMLKRRLDGSLNANRG